MKYWVTLEGEEREVDIQLAGHSPSVTLDGQVLDADVQRVPGGINLIIGGKVYDIVIGESDPMTVASRRVRTKASVQNERARSRNRSKGGMEHAENELRAPMPGRIVKVLVGPGDEVASGDTMVIMEAMKMENELRAQAPNKVSTVEVAEGDSVEGGALLLTFE